MVPSHHPSSLYVILNDVAIIIYVQTLKEHTKLIVYVWNPLLGEPVYSCAFTQLQGVTAVIDSFQYASTQ